MPDVDDPVTEQFERHRPHLRAVAYRLLGSTAEAEDALQDAWLRARDADPQGVENWRAWLTTVVARVSLNRLRAARRERPTDFSVPDLVVTLPGSLPGNVPGAATDDGPEQQAVVADAVGPALLVVLKALTPPQRVALVLHDVFGTPFAEVADVLGCSVAAAQQHASRARRRVRDAPRPDPDVARQRRVVDAFFAAARDGDLDALVTVLAPDVELRIDGGRRRAGASTVLRGPGPVARHTATYASLFPHVRPAIVDGRAGAVVTPGGTVFSVMAFTVVDGRVVRIDALADPERLAALGPDLSL